MELIKSKRQNEYMTFYSPSQPIQSQTTVAKIKIIEMPPTEEEQVVDEKKTTIAFDIFGLFTTTTKKVNTIHVNNDIKKPKCVMTPEMEGILEQVQAAIWRMKPGVKISTPNNLVGPGYDLLVEGQQVTVAPRIIKLKSEGEFIISWTLRV